MPLSLARSSDLCSAVARKRVVPQRLVWPFKRLLIGVTRMGSRARRQSNSTEQPEHVFTTVKENHNDHQGWISKRHRKQQDKILFEALLPRPFLELSAAVFCCLRSRAPFPDRLTACRARPGELCVGDAVIVRASYRPLILFLLIGAGEESARRRRASDLTCCSG